MRTKISVAFCLNDAYAEQLATTLYSILKNNPDENFQFYVIHSDFADSSKVRLEKLKFEFSNFKIAYINGDLSRVAHLKLNIQHISHETYLRYFLADCLPDADRVLYLDVDLCVMKSLRGLWETDVSNHYLAGCSDLWCEGEEHKQKFGFAASDLYVNAGVLLINLKKWREEKLGDVLVQKTIDLADKIAYQDQDVINIVCHGLMRELPPIYNWTTHNEKCNRGGFKKAVIIHYVGGNKPWLSNGTKHKMRHAYIDYWKPARKLLHRRIRVGLLIDEFFGGAGTAYGGYGFLARKYVAKYIQSADIEVDVLLGRGKKRLCATKYPVDNVNLYRLPRFHWASCRWLKKRKYDVYLSIELTTDWVLRHETNPNVKLILWIQDPRPRYEWDEINTVQLFRETSYYDQRIYDTVHSWFCAGRVRFVSQGWFLNRKAVDLYRLPESVPIQYLPNPIEVTHPPLDESKKNHVVFLGRIESVKRGWLFCEIAKKMPEYEFFVLGQTFREKAQNQSIISAYQSVPNLHFIWHVDGDVKAKYLSEAKILVNTSIHEALPISFLEALSYGVCLVSNRNPEELTSKFGVWVGDVLGDGFDKVDLYVNAIRHLLTHDGERQELARAGYEYVRRVHDVRRFQENLRDILLDEAW